LNWPISFAPMARPIAAIIRCRFRISKVIQAVERCRIAALGGHIERCDSCSFERPAYNSCRNRHCPKCQSLAKVKWLDKQKSELLPVGYFHLVFTLPHELNGLILVDKLVSSRCCIPGTRPC
jgi:Transposase zinc-binding domain